MNCSDARLLIVHATTGEDAPSLDEHLAACAACAHDARESARTWDLAATLPRPTLDDESAARIEAQVAAARRREPVRTTRRDWLAMAAALAAFGAILWTLSPRPTAVPGAQDDAFRALVDALRSDDPVVREKASRDLKALGPDRLPDVRRAARETRDAEARARLLDVVDALEIAAGDADDATFARERDALRKSHSSGWTTSGAPGR